jgi:transcriptional regulator with XRE-family HTH domain
MGDDTVPLRVKEIAQSQGLTLTQLHQKTNLSYNTVMNYWHGQVRQMGWSTLVELARVLGVKPKDLIADE